MGQIAAVEPLRLIARIPSPAVIELMLMGSSLRISAADAQRAHLVNEVVAPGRLLDRAMEIARGIAIQSPTAVRTSLEFIRGYPRRQVTDDVVAGWRAVEQQWSHPDATEGPRAFAEKRPPRWSAAQMT
jgi:enoyl-CoA hydratase/carnithine racemase